MPDSDVLRVVSRERYSACPNLVGTSIHCHPGGRRGSSGRFVDSTLVTRRCRLSLANVLDPLAAV